MVPPLTIRHNIPRRPRARNRRRTRGMVLISSGLYATGVVADVFAIMHAIKMNLLAGPISQRQSCFQRFSCRGHAENSPAASYEGIVFASRPSMKNLHTSFIVDRG